MNKSKRLFSFIIDMIIILSFVEIINQVVNTNIHTYVVETEFYKIINNISYDFIFVLAYFFYFDIFKNGTTLAKNILNLKIINNDNLTPKKDILLKRTFVKTLEIIFLPISGIVFLLYDKTLHDIIFNTSVVESNNQSYN
jgi:uncharacterized RDD family membrane protein YckC